MNKRKVPKIRFKGFYDDWEQRKFGDYNDLMTGYPFESDKFSEDGIKLVRGMNVKRGYLDFSEDICMRWNSCVGLENFLLKAGDILIQMDGALIGKSYAKIKENQLPALLVQRVTRSRTNNKFASQDFMYQTIQRDFLRYIEMSKTETAVPHLSLNDIRNFEIMVPCLVEQEKIGAYFSAFDRLITLHQKKCLEWKKKDFTSASISWEQRKLSEMCGTFEYGLNAAAKEFDGKNKYIRITDIDDASREFLLSDLSSPDICLDGMSKYILSSGDIVFARTGASVGKTYIYRENDGIVYFAGFLIRAKVNQDNDAEFVFQSTLSPSYEKYIRITSQRSGQPGVNAQEYGEYDLFAPSKEEQQRIGHFLRGIDNLITLHQRKLELLERLRNSLVDRCFIGEKCTMSKLILYHGSPNRVIVPKFGFGEDRHDYGRGFYLTENLELAKEWAVCRPDETNGWVHKYELEMEGLNILDFQKYDVMSWLAELMKHRDAADSRRYKMLAQKFIEKYGIDTCGYDVITGWGANASYFYIAKEFVRDNIDIEILEELLSLGGLGIQFCIKSERAFAQLSEVEQDIMSVDYSEFNDRYNSGTTICRAARS